MPRKRRKPITPISRLYLALAAVSKGMGAEAARRLAADQAGSIPQTHEERFNTRYKSEIRHARAFMRALPGLPEGELPRAAAEARALADIVWEIMYRPRFRSVMPTHPAHEEEAA